MSEGLKALRRIVCHSLDEDYSFSKQLEKDEATVERELKAFEAIKSFVWVERGLIHIGVRGDGETLLLEDDFETKETYDLLKEALP